MREFEEKTRRGAQETETEMRLAKNSILAQLLHCFALLLIENLCPSCLFCLFLPLSLNICHSHAISLQYDTRPPAREEKKEGEKFKWKWMLRLLRIEIWTEIASDRRLSRNNPSLLLTLPHRPACALPARSLGRSLQFSSPHHFAPHIFCAPSPCLSYLVIHSASSLFLFLVRVFCEAKFAEKIHTAARSTIEKLPISQRKKDCFEIKHLTERRWTNREKSKMKIYSGKIFETPNDEDFHWSCLTVTGKGKWHLKRQKEKLTDCSKTDAD